MSQGSETQGKPAGQTSTQTSSSNLPTGVKLPHMQWNQLEVVRPTPMLEGLDRAWMYFVHSYAPSDETHRVAVCYYPTAITAAVAQDNLWATQFHPEKSGPHGQLLLQNFVQSLR